MLLMIGFMVGSLLGFAMGALMGAVLTCETLEKNQDEKRRDDYVGREVDKDHNRDI